MPWQNGLLIIMLLPDSSRKLSKALKFPGLIQELMHDVSWYEYAIELAQRYHNDLPSPDNLDMELHSWEAR